MSDITHEEIQNAIAPQVSQIMETITKQLHREESKKPVKERSEKQKQNDVKLKERLIEYHRKKRELKSQEIAMKHINDTFKELNNEMKQESKEIKQMIYNEYVKEEEPSIIAVSVVKARKGRPKKIFPEAESICV
jgi:hypothetical protein